MAICAKQQAHAFSHPVEGYIDWQYSRAYVVSKLNKDGVPSECVVYKHHDSIAKLNDTKGGQVKLLAALERDGDRLITLYPIPPRDQEAHKYNNPGKKTGKIDGSRSRRTSLGHGAKARIAFAALGGAA